MRFSHWREVEGPNCLSPFSGNERFRELQSLLPDVTQRMLTMQLHELEADGVIERRVYPEVPPKVDYSLSEAGKTLESVIDAMWDWGTRYFKACPHAGKERKSITPLAPEGPQRPTRAPRGIQ